MQVSMQQFEAAAQAALDEIPDEFQRYLENTVFIIEESSADGLMGLYEGATALDAGEGMPERITLFKRSHEAAAATLDELVAGCGGPSCTSWAITLGWRRTSFLTEGSRTSDPTGQVDCR